MRSPRVPSPAGAAHPAVRATGEGGPIRKTGPAGVPVARAEATSGIDRGGSVGQPGPLGDANAALPAARPDRGALRRHGHATQPEGRLSSKGQGTSPTALAANVVQVATMRRGHVPRSAACCPS